MRRLGGGAGHSWWLVTMGVGNAERAGAWEEGLNWILHTLEAFLCRVRTMYIPGGPWRRWRLESEEVGRWSLVYEFILLLETEIERLRQQWMEWSMGPWGCSFP
jgi:hypothetical protein